MNATDQLILAKYASTLGQATGHAAIDAFLPISTYTRVHDDEGWRGAGAGLTTDFSRGMGGLLGMTALKGLESSKLVQHYPAGPEARAALMMAALGAGATAGHFRGKQLGESMFHPGTRLQRLRRAIGSY